MGHHGPARHRSAPYTRRVHPRAKRRRDPADRGGVRIRSGARRAARHRLSRQCRGLAQGADGARRLPPCRGLTRRQSQRRSSPRSPSRPRAASSVASRPAPRARPPAPDRARQLPITRQAITKPLELLSAAGLVLAEPGERRRIRYRVNAAPMAMAQSYLAALARDWDSKLARLQRSLDAPAPPPEGTDSTDGIEVGADGASAGGA